MMTIEKLKEMLAENNFKQTNITMDNGDIIRITPCGYDDIKSVDDIEYYLVYSALPYLGGDKIETVVEQINSYEKLIKENEQEKDDLQAFYDKNIAPKLSDPNWKPSEDDDLQYYSDWHKDLYGYRPRL